MVDHLRVLKQDTSHHGIDVIPVSTVGKYPRRMTAMQILHMATGNPYHWVNPWIQQAGCVRTCVYTGDRWEWSRGARPYITQQLYSRAASLQQFAIRSLHSRLQRD